MEKKQIKLIHCAAEDKVTVVNLLEAAAAKFQLFDNTLDSRVENTLRSFSEAPFHGFGLGARIIGDMIVIDLNSKLANGASFNILWEFICNKVEAAFGDRARIADSDDYLEIENTLPISDQMRRRFDDFRES